MLCIWLNGADVIDLGAASSNPVIQLEVGVVEKSKDSNLSLRLLKKKGISISVDTFKPEVQVLHRTKG